MIINIHYVNEDSDDVIFYLGVLSLNLNNINLDDTNYNEDDAETIILLLFRLLAWHGKFEKHNALIKLNEKLMLVVAWHPRRWWDFCMSKDEKKEIGPIFSA